MAIVGQFAGEAAGDPDSSWFFVSIMGLFPLLSIPFIWLIDSDTSKTKNRENK